jgi:protein-disulfide isomerase
VLLLLIFGVGVGAAVYLGGRQRAAEAPIIASSSTFEKGSIWISPADPSWGARDAPVTIVEFADFQCPFCKKVDGTLNVLKTKYGPEALRIVWKNNPLPFHKSARPAAIAAMVTFELGGNEAFWRFHDHAFAAQDALVDESFASWALDAGVDMVKWRAGVASSASELKIDASISVAKEAGATGTPAFFINGVLVSGAQSLDRFVEVIEAQQTAARAAIAAGTRPDDVYARLSLENKAKAPPPKEDAATAKDETTVWRVPVGMSPSRGLASAPVTIVEVGDFQCPFCKRAEKTLTDVRARYGDKVRVVWKNNPLAFHARAEPAAEVAMEAFVEQGDAVFWQMHDLLYENQAHLEDADLLGYAARLRVRGAAAAIADRKHATRIKADQALANSLGATGTPTFFINGRRLVGAQPLEKFAAIIDEELRHAAEIVARGAAKASVYAEIQKSAKDGK